MPNSVSSSIDSLDNFRCRYPNPSPSPSQNHHPDHRRRYDWIHHVDASASLQISALQLHEQIQTAGPQ